MIRESSSSSSSVTLRSSTSIESTIDSSCPILRLSFPPTQMGFKLYTDSEVPAPQLMPIDLSCRCNTKYISSVKSTRTLKTSSAIQKSHQSSGPSTQHVSIPSTNSSDFAETECSEAISALESIIEVPSADNRSSPTRSQSIEAQNDGQTQALDESHLDSKSFKEEKLPSVNQAVNEDMEEDMDGSGGSSSVSDFFQDSSPVGTETGTISTFIHF